MEDGAFKVLRGPAIALPPNVGGKQRFDWTGLAHAVMGGAVLGAVTRVLPSLAVLLPGTFLSAAGVGLAIGVILIVASDRSAGAGGGGPQGPDWFDLLLRAIGIAVVFGSAAFVAIELVQNPPVTFWPRSLIGAFATLFWWRQVLPQIPKGRNVGYMIVSWFGCVAAAIGASEQFGLV